MDTIEDQLEALRLLKAFMQIFDADEPAGDYRTGRGARGCARR